MDIRSILQGATVAVACALVGCGGGGGGSAGAQQFERSFVNTACDRAHACRDSFPGTDAQFVEYFEASASACKSANAPVDDPDLLDALDRGTVLYVSSQGSACLTALRNATCEELWGEFPDSCNMVYAGTVEEGGECVIDEECEIVDSYCDGTCMSF